MSSKKINFTDGYSTETVPTTEVPSGPTGPEGLQGIQGDQGIQGIQGIQGDSQITQSGDSFAIYDSGDTALVGSFHFETNKQYSILWKKTGSITYVEIQLFLIYQKKM